jgi:hypothetical protein
MEGEKKGAGISDHETRTEAWICGGAFFAVEILQSRKRAFRTTGS